MLQWKSQVWVQLFLEQPKLSIIAFVCYLILLVVIDVDRSWKSSTENVGRSWSPKRKLNSWKRLWQRPKSIKFVGYFIICVHVSCLLLKGSWDFQFWLSILNMLLVTWPNRFYVFSYIFSAWRLVARLTW